MTLLPLPPGFRVQYRPDRWAPWKVLDAQYGGCIAVASTGLGARIIARRIARRRRMAARLNERAARWVERV